MIGQWADLEFIAFLKAYWNLTRKWLLCHQDLFWQLRKQVPTILLFYLWPTPIIVEEQKAETTEEYQIESSRVWFGDGVKESSDSILQWILKRYMPHSSVTDGSTLMKKKESVPGAVAADTGAVVLKTFDSLTHILLHFRPPMLYLFPDRQRQGSTQWPEIEGLQPHADRERTWIPQYPNTPIRQGFRLKKTLFLLSLPSLPVFSAAGRHTPPVWLHIPFT